MSVRLTNAGWIAYAVACELFWIWLFWHHAIPHGIWANEMLSIVIVGGVVFGLYGFVLNGKLLTDPRVDLVNGLIIYGFAGTVALIIHSLLRGIPDTPAAWMAFIIMWLSLSGALYVFCRAIGTRAPTS